MSLSTFPFYNPLYEPNLSLNAFLLTIGLLITILLINMLFFDFLNEVFDKKENNHKKLPISESVILVKSNPLLLCRFEKANGSISQKIIVIVLSLLICFQVFASLLNPFHLF